MVRTPFPSSATRQAVVSGVAHFLEPNDPLTSLLQDAQAGLEVFSLGLRSAATGGEGLAGAKPVGWRIIVGKDSEWVAAHVNRALGDSAPRMTSLSRGPEVLTESRVADLLHNLQEAQDQDYEARVLRIPGVSIEAFWLKPASGPGWAVPFVSLTEGLEVGQVYRMGDFLEKMRTLADKRLAYEDAQPQA